MAVETKGRPGRFPGRPPFTLCAPPSALRPRLSECVPRRELELVVVLRVVQLHPRSVVHDLRVEGEDRLRLVERALRPRRLREHRLPREVVVDAWQIGRAHV